ncbi:hypothetical protein QBC35DRAFT_510003 [Podospora australis]|uniref:Uncharacterized protein n=1 Tax=Podospora australis TaxID=1536484 RepID=A0AAN6WIU8_9PEZI|nr:hypothetical protein QBC35DRAFT_510003 [Podospora australis]
MENNQGQTSAIPGSPPSLRRQTSRASTQSSRTARASTIASSSSASASQPIPQDYYQFFEYMKEFLKPMIAISVLGCPVTFALIVAPLADPSTLNPSSSSFKFSLETVRLLISISWLCFTLTLGISAFTYIQLSYRMLITGLPRINSFYYDWLNIVVNVFNVLAMGAFLLLSLAVSAYVPIVGWVAVGVIGAYVVAVHAYWAVERLREDSDDDTDTEGATEE